RRLAGPALPRGAEVVVAYADPGRAGWLPDGVAFGRGPVRPGDVRFGDSAERPLVKVFDRAAAEKDPAWDGLKPAAGAEEDPGILGGLERAGRTLRTPTFPITGGKLFHLARGSGQVSRARAQQ